MCGKVKSTKWFHPYEEKKGKKNICSLKLKKAVPGVYIIKELQPNGRYKIVYVGMSGYDVKRIFYRHFQKWTDRRGHYQKKMSRLDRVSYKHSQFKNTDYLCKILFVDDERMAYVFEENLIMKINPRDNKLKLEKYQEYRQEVEDGYKNADIVDYSEEVPF